MSSKKVHRGQMTSADAAAATLVFAALIVFASAFWQVSITSQALEAKRIKLEASALTISDMLVRSTGFPENWEKNQTSVQAIGLAKTPNVLDEKKLANFTSLDYALSRQALGTDYEYYFYVEDLDGDKIYQAGNASEGNLAASVSRLALLGSEKVKVWLVLHD